jgi:ABC-type glycerol-3-phosphate transport system substrate-binding protein
MIYSINKRINISFHVLLTSLVLLAAPLALAQTPADTLTPNPELEAELEVWAWTGALEALQAVDEAFNELYPNIRVNYVMRPYGETMQQISLAAAAGAGLPDVSAVGDMNLAQLAPLGILVDLTERVEPYLPLMNAYKWSQAESDGRYYAMPWDSGPVAIFYRRDVFEEANVDPATIQTWEDYYQAAVTIHEATNLPMWQAATARNDGRLFEMLLWQRGLGYVDAEGNVILDRDPRIREVLEYMGRFWQEELAADSEPWTDPWYREMAEGTVATVPGAVWMGTFFKSFIAPEAVGNWGVFKLPVWEEGDAQASIDGGSHLVIFEQSHQQEAAWAYIEFHLGRTQSQLTMYRETDIFPSLETTYDDPYFQEPDPYYRGQPVHAIFTEVVKDVPIAGIYTVDYPEMNSLLEEEIQRFATGQQSAEEALARAARSIRDRTGRR